MKRFYVALFLVALIVITAAFSNIKVGQKSEELIELVNQDAEADTIHSWWNENKIWFEIFVPEELKIGVETDILLYKNSQKDNMLKDKIKTSAEKIYDSTEITLSNIF